MSEKTKLWQVHAEKIAEDVVAAFSTKLGLTRIVEIIGQTVEIVEDDPNFDIEDGIVVKFDDWNLEEKWFVAELAVLEEFIDRIIVECDTKDEDSMSDAWQWFVGEHLWAGGKPGTRARSLDFVSATVLRGEHLYLDYNSPRESATAMKEELDNAKE